MKKLQLSILAAIILGVVMVVVPLGGTLYAQNAKASVCKGIGLAGGGSDNCTPDQGVKVDDIVTAAINIFSIVVGVIAVIMIIIGGLKYVMSSGDSNNINSAKNTILYAIIGLVIVAFAQVIVKFVLHNV